MKIGSSTIRRLGIGAVAVIGGYLGHLSLTQAPDGPEPVVYPLYEPVGDWATWADKPAYAPNLAGQVFDITDYGAIPDDQVQDTLEFRAALAAAKVWQDANAGALVTIYMPEGEYLLWPDLEYESLYVNYVPRAIELYQDNLVIEGDGPDKTILNFRGVAGENPNTETLYRGWAFTTFGSPTAIDGITFRGFRATGNAPTTNQAGVYSGVGSLTGWDTTHKFLAIYDDINVTNVTLEDLELDNWRGEIAYGGGGGGLGTFMIRRCIIRQSNASAISMGGDLTVENCDIYDVYNATECQARGAPQQLTVRNSTIDVNRNQTGDLRRGKFGVVYIGYATSSLLVEDNIILNTNSGGIFLSECASNVTIQRNAFTDTLGLTCTYLNLYSDFDTEENTWDDWLVDDNTFHTTAGTQDSVFLLVNNPSSANGWVFSNNVVTRDGESRYDKFLRTENGAEGTFSVTGNTIDESIPFFDDQSKNPIRATWTGNTVTGAYAQGNVFASYLAAADPTPLTIRPTWDRVNVYDLGNLTQSRIIDIDPALLSLFPTGFTLRIVREAFNSGFSAAEIIPAADWNTLTRGYMLLTGGVLNLVKNAGGKFELVSYTPNPVNIRTLTETASEPYRLSAADIAFFGQLEVNLFPSGAHAFSTFSGVAIGETVAINHNANVTIEHVPGVMEISTAADFVASGSGSLSATRDAAGVLQITIP